MKEKIEEVKAAYAALVARGEELDAELTRLTMEEAEKAASLADRKDELALRIRSAYDTDRTSLLETFLSGGSFTDILAEASYMIDVGEQDKALAEQIERDQAALAAVHQTVEETRLATEELRVETAAQKKKLDKSMRDLKKEQAKLKKLERAAERELARQKAAYEQLAKNKKGLKKAIARAQASQRALAKRIDRIIAQQRARGNIPSKFNGSFRWPMVGRISGEFGCSSYPGYGPGYGCAHFHNGIDIVAGYGTPGPGRRQGHGRVRRLELRRRLRPGLDRRHRPLRRTCRRGTPTCSRERPGVGGPARESGPGHRLRGQHRELDRRPPALDGRAQRGLEEPEAVPLAPARRFGQAALPVGR